MANIDVMAENLQHSFSNAFHTPHEDLEMEEPEEGDCDEALKFLHMELYEDPEETEELGTLPMIEILRRIMMTMPLNGMGKKQET